MQKVTGYTPSWFYTAEPTPFQNKLKTFCSMQLAAAKLVVLSGVRFLVDFRVAKSRPLEIYE